MVFDSFHYLIFFILGLEFGSFANVCIYRWPRGKTTTKPLRSFCPWCQTKLRWVDNIPVLSFFFLRRQCRSCHSNISWRYPIVETLMGMSWVLLAFFINTHLGPVSLPFLILNFAFVFVLIVTTLTDLDWKIIPDETTYGLIFLCLILSPFNEYLPAKGIQERLLLSGQGVAIGFLVPYFLSWLGRVLLKREALGGGDVKLLAGFGGLLGWQGAIASLVLGSFLGGLISIFGILVGKLKRHQYIPFGPFLNAGALITLLLLILNGRWYTLFF